MNRKIGILVLLFLLVLSSSGFADSPGLPYSYKKILADGKLVFVMLSPSIIKEPGFENYPNSGLYYNDGSNNSIWAVDWYSGESGVFFSSDGGCLARFGPWPGLNNKGQPDLNQLAVAFYKEGQLMKQYQIGDLIVRPEILQRSVSHFTWTKRVSFDKLSNQLSITTADAIEYIFDLCTGEIVREN